MIMIYYQILPSDLFAPHLTLAAYSIIVLMADFPTPKLNLTRCKNLCKSAKLGLPHSPLPPEFVKLCCNVHDIWKTSLPSPGGSTKGSG